MGDEPAGGLGRFALVEGESDGFHYAAVICLPESKPRAQEVKLGFSSWKTMHNEAMGSGLNIQQLDHSDTTPEVTYSYDTASRLQAEG
jgi:hypothetical protein